MKIVKLELHNWKNFPVAEVDVAQRMFVIGPNAAGKSNLLDALLFLRDIARSGGGLQEAIRQRGGLTKIRSLAARRYPLVEIKVTLQEDDQKTWVYEIGIRQQNAGRRLPLLSYEKVTCDGNCIVNRPEDSDKADEERLTQTYLEQINANQAFRDVARFLASIRYLHLVPQLVRNPAAYRGPERNSGQREDVHGLNFLDALARTTEKTRNARLKKIEEALRQAVPQLKEFTFTKDESGVPHLQAIYEHWRAQGAKQQEDQFSDGTLRLLGLFWSLLDGDAPLLLEEPEISLNTEIVKKLPALFHKLQRRNKRQIFVTTHSREMLEDKGIDPGEVIELTPSAEGTKVQALSANSKVTPLLQAGMSIADTISPSLQLDLAL